ncbi:MAG: nucleotide exchange factor GrpE, partial [Bacteroidota bacterium]
MSKQASEYATSSSEPQVDTLPPEELSQQVQQDATSQEDGPVADSVVASPEKALTQAQQALQEANEKHLRLYAEFENFRRREAKEKLARIAAASQNVLEKLLPIVDDFERALQVLQADDATQEGIQLIYDKLSRLLQQEGVQPMELAPGATFDPELHEAITQAP